MIHEKKAGRRSFVHEEGKKGKEKPGGIPNRRKSKLGLPDLEGHAKSAVLVSMRVS